MSPEPPSAGDSAPDCPHCGSSDTEPMARFGTVLGTAQCYCNGCSTAFERMKWGSED